MYSWNDGVLIELSRIEICTHIEESRNRQPVLIELSRIEIEERQGDTRDEIQVLIELSRIEMKQCRKQQNFRHQY